MSQESDLKILVRRAYLSYHQDGLIDVLIGWMVLSFGIYLLLDSSVIIFLAWFPLLSYVPIKNKLTIPRLGYVKFNGVYNQTKRTHLGIVLSCVLILSILVFTVLLLGENNVLTTIIPLRGNGLVIYGVVVALLLLMSGLFSGIWRLTSYGLLCVALAIAGILAKLPDYLLFIVLGLVILLIGAVLMILFIRKYPLALNRGDHDTE
jgi:hypothetical protein